MQPEVTILGAGIVGIFTGLALAERGVRVRLIDRVLGLAGMQPAGEIPTEAVDELLPARRSPDHPVGNGNGHGHKVAAN